MKLKDDVNPNSEVPCNACPQDSSATCPPYCPTVKEVFSVVNNPVTWQDTFKEIYCDE